MSTGEENETITEKSTDASNERPTALKTAEQEKSLRA
jgi:hypothetical protein